MTTAEKIKLQLDTLLAEIQGMQDDLHKKRGKAIDLKYDLEREILRSIEADKKPKEPFAAGSPHLPRLTAWLEGVRAGMI